MGKWKEETKGGTTSCEIVEGPIRIWVGNGHIRNPDFWTLHCPALGMNTVNLKLPADQAADLAKMMAVNMVRNEIKKLSAAIAKLG